LLQQDKECLGMALGRGGFQPWKCLLRMTILQQMIAQYKSSFRITLLCGLLQQWQGLGGIGLFQKGGGLPAEDIRSGGHGLRADIKVEDGCCGIWAAIPVESFVKILLGIVL